MWQARWQQQQRTWVSPLRVLSPGVAGGAAAGVVPPPLLLFAVLLLLLFAAGSVDEAMMERQATGCLGLSVRSITWEPRIVFTEFAWVAGNFHVG
jgi:hypothetical protein